MSVYGLTIIAEVKDEFVDTTIVFGTKAEKEAYTKAEFKYCGKARSEYNSCNYPELRKKKKLELYEARGKFAESQGFNLNIHKLSWVKKQTHQNIIA